MSYTNLTKAQLIERIQELEQQSFQARLGLVKRELFLAWEDLTKVVRWFYDSGVQTRKAVQGDKLYQAAVASVRSFQGSSTASP